MLDRFRLGAAALVAVLASTPALAEELTIGTLASGTVRWELDTIQHYGLDKAEGFDLKITELAGNPATQIALAGGEVDAIVSDWLWVAQQRAEGKNYVFIPFSTAVGALLVPQDSPAQTLADLKGKKIGIAGGPVDKSWLILRAYARQETGEDLATVTEQVFGAPPMIYEAGLSGEVDGVINFWNFLAKMKVHGMRELITVAEAATALGLDPATPLLGYVMDEQLVQEKPELAAALKRASRAAKELLLTDEAAWQRLRPIMNAEDDAEYAALREGWRQGVPADAPVDEANAAKVFALMVELGGEELLGQVKELPEGVFYKGD
ncbi:ABC transporter substrate-binding protein [Tabrizicola sp.]|uniref:ABC transporter substrate-binding protein n=1 Tax=Tabrizicola sp. TaxID=2005166 RepID=UPI0025CD6FF0|nr:ABC transporter substrate-binding protein [Tabrizicola sp.]